MNLKFLSNIVSGIPYPLGRIFTGVPYQFRLGRTYTDFSRLIDKSQGWSIDEKVSRLVKSLQNIKHKAQNSFHYYEKLYVDFGCFDLKIKDLNDWEKLPLISKEDLRHNVQLFRGHQRINTGGTSGEPFSLYIDKRAWAREWAHMHYIWRMKGYEYTLPKITLRGRDLGSSLFKYNLIHNEFIFNTYKNFSDRNNALTFKKLVLAKRIKFVHGYPSAIYNFFKEIEKCLTDSEIEEIKSSIKVCLMGSEYPVNYMVEYLKRKWEFDYISWYGHSEMCVLAYDINKDNTYVPFLTYGYPEAVNGELIGTSFHNTDMPLIRYKTGDLIYGEIHNNLLKSFSITEGRSGDFIEDKHGKKIPLTGLIFGRHHCAFDVFDFIQVKQDVAGSSTILVTNKSGKMIKNIEQYFNLDNVEIDFHFEVLKNPILSKSGKFKLKI